MLGRSECASDSALAADARKSTTLFGVGGVCAIAIETVINNSARISSPVARVDANVVFREIAGPEPSAPFASAADRKVDRALLLVQLSLQFVFTEIGGKPCPANRRALQVDVDA